MKMMLSFLVAGNLVEVAWLPIRRSPTSVFAAVSNAAVLMNSQRFIVCDVLSNFLWAAARGLIHILARRLWCRPSLSNMMMRQ